MEIIPVIDLLAGQVVHARAGDRDNYHPLHTALCPFSEPQRVVEALLAIYSFRTLYIADLDEIQARGSNREIIELLHQRFPGLCLWIDSAVKDESSLTRFREHGFGDPVIGSETLESTDFLSSSLLNVKDDPLVSLDFFENEFRGPTGLADTPELWTSRVIVMSLSQVGRNRGPDFDHLKRYQELSPATKWYAAGGVRGISDLETLAAMRISGVLVASSLHNGSLQTKQIEQFEKSVLRAAQPR